MMTLAVRFPGSAIWACRTQDLEGRYLCTLSQFCLAASKNTLMAELVTQDERNSYELELSGLTTTEMKAIKTRYESDDDPNASVSHTENGIDWSNKSPMHA